MLAELGVRDQRTGASENLTAVSAMSYWLLTPDPLEVEAPIFRHGACHRSRAWSYFLGAERWVVKIVGEELELFAKGLSKSRGSVFQCVEDAVGEIDLHRPVILTSSPLPAAAGAPGSWPLSPDWPLPPDPCLRLPPPVSASRLPTPDSRLPSPASRPPLPPPVPCPLSPVPCPLSPVPCPLLL
jgi:hypothetical protein